MGNINNLKPFQSGFDPRRNLNGRPPGKTLTSQFQEILSKRIASDKDKTIADALVEKIIKMALDGDHRMIKLIWEHMDGKPPKHRGDPELVRPPKRELSEKEIERYGDFRSKVLGMTEDDKIRQNKLDIRGYMKYILEKGTIQEKRELMQSFTSKLVLIDKRIILE